MIVEAIDFSEKYNLIILTIDDEDFSISYDLYNDLSLQTDDEISFETYKIILSDDERNRAKNFALNKISFSQKTSYELIKLLRDNDFSEEAISYTLSFLDEYGLIDDEAFVKSYVADKHNISRWSKNKIRYSLKSKNIEDDLIDTYLAEIDDEDEYQNVYDFALKKARGDFSRDNKQKVYRYLASKGFDFDLINKAVGEIFK